MMKKVISIGIIFLMLSVFMASSAGCSQRIEPNNEPVILTEASKKDCNIELYIKQDIKLGKYEPPKGVYLGAYVDRNSDIHADITAFEEIVGQPQTFKVFQYTMGKGLSSQDILKCIAQRKVPYIKILLGNDRDLTPLYRMISDLNSSYSVPIFIELFPLTQNLSQPLAYKEIYQRAYEIIEKYLEHAVIVWSVDDSRLYDMPLYYPGDHLADWVGINLYIPQYKDNVKYSFSNLEGIDFWYKSFQKSKPMMISSLAISHFSRVDHTYSLKDAEYKLNLFYQEMLSIYPRIKGILYIDVDMGEVVKNGKEDYRITSQKELADYMKHIFKREDFLDELQESDQNEAPIYMKYDITAAQFGEELYLSKKYMNALFRKVPLSKVTMLEDLNGEKYYKLDDVKQYIDIYYKSEKQ
ncbi:MAG: hypothetical protein K0S71_1363 [Clostridia bacterium]|jgi:hypothetical protein|nr:hypothetical protein [Clostridia bacterium]